MDIPDAGAGPDDGSSGTDALPEAADRRLASESFSSGLSVPEFAACLQMGLRPVGLVQGFCVMQWGWYGASSPYMRGGGPYAPGGAGTYSTTWQCPHGFVSAEHRSWGQNYEQPWVQDAWATGFGSAYERLVDEARAVGAHGVIGVVDRTRHISDMGVTEFHIMGTAVVVEDGPPPEGGQPWTTYLAGQRLAKLVEAGFMPVSIAASLASVRVWAYCVTELLMEGGSFSWGSGYGPQEVAQITEAHTSARHLARKHVRGQLDGDTLHGARMEASVRELAQGDQVIECTLRGNRVRRFREASPLPVPRPTVRLS